MYVTARSHLTAGVALVGAGAIALAPIQPIDPSWQDIAMPVKAVSSTPVELTALVNPIELWADVLARSAGNFGELASTFLASPAPILEAILRSQLASATTLAEVLGPVVESLIEGIGNVPADVGAALNQIASGDIANGVGFLAVAFITPIATAMFPLLLGGGLDKITAILQNPFDNISRVIGRLVSPLTLGQVGLPLLSEILAPIVQVGITAQAIYDGFTAGDFEAVVNAIISFPSDLVNTVLNGSPNPVLANQGLLGPGGLFASLLGLRQAIADVITPPAGSPPSPLAESASPLAAADEVPGSGADVLSVSLSTDSVSGDTPAAATPVADDAPGEEEPITGGEEEGDDTTGSGETEPVGTDDTEGTGDEDNTEPESPSGTDDDDTGDDTGDDTTPTAGSDTDPADDGPKSPSGSDDNDAGNDSAGSASSGGSDNSGGDDGDE